MSRPELTEQWQERFEDFKASDMTVQPRATITEPPSASTTTGSSASPPDNNRAERPIDKAITK